MPFPYDYGQSTILFEMELCGRHSDASLLSSERTVCLLESGCISRTQFIKHLFILIHSINDKMEMCHYNIGDRAWMELCHHYRLVRAAAREKEQKIVCLAADDNRMRWEPATGITNY